MQSHQLPTLVVILSLWFTLIAFVLYADTLAKVLKKCAPASRTMKPGKVWLLLIPVFGLIWHFVVVTNITKSLGNEFARRGVPRPDPTLGRTIGLASCFCNFFIFAPVPLLLGDLVKIVGFFLWIAYWRRIHDYSEDLAVLQGRTLAPPVASDSLVIQPSSQSRQGDSSEIARDRVSEQSHSLPYRWILPVGQLLICAVVIWPIRSEIVFQTRATIRSYGAVKHLEPKPNDVLPDSGDVNLNEPQFGAPSMLDLPVLIIQLPYVFYNPAKTEFVPNGMSVKIWRAISWPFVGLIFWWIAGRGVEALLASRRSVIDPSIGWVETGVGVFLLACGVIILITGVLVGDSDWVFMAGGGAIWALLGAAIVIARIAQWRIRLRLRDVQSPPDLLSA
jgi:hypothetical protein